MALPSIAAVLDFDLPQTNVILIEEENHSSSVTIFEKTIPKTLDIHDFIKFFETSHKKEAFADHQNGFHANPHLSIFSPPPEA